MKFMAFLLGLIALVALRFALNSGYRKVVATATSDKPSSCLIMVGSTTREEEGFTYIVGSIRNDCGRAIGNVTIAFKLDPKPQSKFHLPDASVFAYSRNIQPGETRPFKTALHIGKDSTYRFGGITAF